MILKQISNVFIQSRCHLSTLATQQKPSILTTLAEGFKNQMTELQYHQLHIQASKNNTIATFTDPVGKIIASCSAGMCGLKKANRGTSDGGYMTVIELIKRVTAKNAYPKDGVHLKVKGFGPGREQGFRALYASGWVIRRITDVTPYRHAGCRPPKKRKL